MITVEIKNCNNVASGSFCLTKNLLNIRYAMNGTGKSTIAKAIHLSATGGDLKTLKSFGETSTPSCTITPALKKVLIFDETFVSTIVFRESEVIANAFEVFIRSLEYDQKQKDINERLKELHLDLASNEEYARLVSTGKLVLDKLSKTTNASLKKVGLVKSLISTASVFKLPEKIKKYQPLMDSEHNIDWVGWKNDGGKFDDNAICPFCTITLGDDYAEEKKTFAESYSKSNVKNIREVIGYFDQVSDYMDPEKRDILYRCVKETTEEDTILLWLNRFYLDLDYLVTRIQQAIQFNSYAVRKEQISGLSEHLKSMLIDCSNLEVFNSKKTQDLVSDLNNRIDAVRAEADELKIEIGSLKGLIGSSIKKAVKDINEFLDMAAIDYILEINHESESVTKTILKYKKKGKDAVNVENIRHHLSWGERNAFALVLFLHYAATQNPELIILDDPISSFDSNKKYAIMNRVFANDLKVKTLYKKTVLMLTHDFQPVIDFIVNSKPHRGATEAAFLRNENGTLEVTAIGPGDIRSFTKQLFEAASNDQLDKVHRVSSLRKLVEHTARSREQKLAYNVLSCLLHLKPILSYVDDTLIDPLDVAVAETYVRTFIADFTYATYLSTHFSQSELAKTYIAETNEYFKVQVFRILMEIHGLRSKIDDPLLKYIDEQFHVENDYVFFLDYTKYNTVPTFVVPKCDEFLKREGIIA
ncbi:MAG TPA: hypothetical protein DEB35_10280 [Desulfuromonas sp.]|nr:hypothetical protein [Desulfuromonas sp.]